MRLCDGDGDDLGLAHLPRPVQPGDVAALEHGPPLRIVALVEPGVVELLAEVEPARMPVTG